MSQLGDTITRQQKVPPSSTITAHCQGIWRCDDAGDTSTVVIADYSGQNNDATLAAAGGPSANGTDVSADFWQSGFVRIGATSDNEYFTIPGLADIGDEAAYILATLEVRRNVSPASAGTFIGRSGNNTSGMKITAADKLQWDHAAGDLAGSAITLTAWTRLTMAWDPVAGTRYLFKNLAADGSDATALTDQTSANATTLFASRFDGGAVLLEADVRNIELYIDSSGAQLHTLTNVLRWIHFNPGIGLPANLWK